MRSLRVANVLPLIYSRLMRLKDFIQTTHYFWCFAHCQSKPREHSPGQDAVLTAGYLDPLTSPSTGISESSKGVQQSINNGTFDTTHVSPGEAQNLGNKPQTRSTFTQTEEIDSILLVQPTPLQPSGDEPDCQSISSQDGPSYPREPTGLSKATPKLITVTPSPDRMVKRSLKGIHIFVCQIPVHESSILS